MFPNRAFKDVVELPLHSLDTFSLCFQDVKLSLLVFLQRLRQVEVTFLIQNVQRGFIVVYDSCYVFLRVVDLVYEFGVWGFERLL